MNAAPSPARAAAEPAFAKATFEADGLLPRIALAALAAFQVALIVTHEPWRDELQALMLAQHSTSLADLFANLHYEGHPALWYLILRALAPFGHGPEVLKAVQIAVTLSTIAHRVDARAVRAVAAASRPRRLSDPLRMGDDRANLRARRDALFRLPRASNRRPLAAYLFLASWPTPPRTSCFSPASRRAPFRPRRAGVLFRVGALRGALAGRRRHSLAGVRRTHHDRPCADASWPLHGRARCLPGTLTPFDPSVIPPRWKGLPLAAAIWAGMLAPAIGAFAIMPRSPIAAALFLLLTPPSSRSRCSSTRPSHATLASSSFSLVGTEWLLLANAVMRAAVAFLAHLDRASRRLRALVRRLGSRRPVLRDALRLAHDRRAPPRRRGSGPSIRSFHGPEISARLNRPFYDLQQQCLAWYQKWNAASGEGNRPKHNR